MAPYAAKPARRQALPYVHQLRAYTDAPGENSAQTRDIRLLIAIAATMFVWLFGWGSDYFNWSDPSGTIQLALFTSFVLGIMCGYKTRS